MFIEQLDVVDLILEGTKALLGCSVVFILWRSGKKYPELSGGSWNIILLGFLCIAIGLILDFSDEIINYNVNETIGFIEKLIEEGVLMLGFIMVTFGFDKWSMFVGRFLGIKQS
ncbi:MAG: hypothetical protein KAG10_00775 [Methylococcales bacterium]|nr:hypothetical protein [Methylococcales bacterium]MCK5924405.1 hypothetical protein [Methylococcales bacterium]